MGRAGGEIILVLPLSSSLSGFVRESINSGTGSLFIGLGGGAENSLGIAGVDNLGSGFSFDTFGFGGDVELFSLSELTIFSPVNKSCVATPSTNRISEIFFPLESHSVHTPCSRLFLKL